VLERLSRRLLAWLRVPPEPHLPAGDPASARVFRAAPGYWRLQLLRWSAGQASTLLGFVVLVVMLQVAPATMSVYDKGVSRRIPLTGSLALVRTLESVAWLVWIVQLPLTFAVMRLDYELRWYIVTDRAARVREGIVNLREMTFTLANVQDIRIHQGPVQRLFGLADVELRTAGGSEPGPAGNAHSSARENLHLARFRGVSDAEAIRDLVLDRMKKARGAGLGDPDDPHDAAPDAPDQLTAALEELRTASAALREAAARCA
jgi:membrane protein YdbS with pleckstrin-like domain